MQRGLVLKIKSKTINVNKQLLTSGMAENMISSEAKFARISKDGPSGVSSGPMHRSAKKSPCMATWSMSGYLSLCTLFEYNLLALVYFISTRKTSIKLHRKVGRRETQR